jgi:glycosyltransferase involved in cell wall biosynthesis
MEHTISAVIITHNEEKNIGRCLDSLMDIVDEIVVVDAQSTDATESICRQKKVNFYSRSWEGYDAAKNYGNELATSAYILSIDADEELNDELQQSIVSAKSSGLTDAYEVNRLTNYCGKWIRHSGWYPEWKLRLFKKNSASWKGSVHENLIFEGSNPKTLRLEGNLLHYSFPTIESQLMKTITYSTLAAKRDIENGKKYSLASVVVKSAFLFIRKYFLQLGFLDGFEGYAIARFSALEKLVRYAKIRELLRKKRRGDLR